MANVIEFTLKTKDLASATFKKFAGGLTSAAKTVARFGVAATAGAVATFAFVKQIANAQDVAGKFAFRIGKLVEQLTAYQHVANLAGVETRTFNMALQRMERRVAQAAEGTGEAVAVLRDFGIEAGEFAKLRIDEQLGILSDKFVEMGDSTATVTQAFKLFDSEGVSMLQMLKQGSPAMREMADQARLLGLVISEQAAANSAEFNDSLTRLWGSITGTSRAVGNELMPMMTGLADVMTEFVVQNRDRVTNFFKSMLGGFLTVGIIGKIAIQDLSDKITGTFNAQGFDEFVSGFKQAVTFIVNSAPAFVIGYGSVLIAGFKVIWEGFVTAGKWAWDSVKSFFGGAKTISLGELIFGKLGAATAAARAEFDNTLGDFAGVATTQGKKVSDALGGMITINAEAAALQAQKLVETLSVFGDASEEARGKEETASRTFLQTMTGNYQEYIAKQKTVTEQLAISTQAIFISATQSIGDAVAESIVNTQNLAELLKNVANEVLKSVISMLVQVGIQRLASAALSQISTVKETSAKLAGQAAIASAYGFTASAALGLPGLVAAPAVAAGASASMLAGATSAGAAGKAVGATIPAFHGGINYVPSEQTALVDKGERIISPNQNRDLTSFLSEGGGRAGGGVVIENINILPNATNAQALLDMSPEDMRRVVEEKIIDALDELDNMGIRQTRLEAIA